MKSTFCLLTYKKKRTILRKCTVYLACSVVESNNSTPKLITLAQKTAQKAKQKNAATPPPSPLPQRPLLCSGFYCGSPYFGCSYSSTFYCCSCSHLFIFQPRCQCILRQHSAPWLNKRRCVLLPPHCCGGTFIPPNATTAVWDDFVGGVEEIFLVLQCNFSLQHQK